VIASEKTSAQARIVLNGATINITQGAYLVVANSATNAITRTTGSIISEGENNIVKWNIGTATGTYIIPWSYNGTYIPMSFSPTGATGAGYFQFATYHTGWMNSDQLPTGVTNFNRASGLNNSAYALDRFWKVDAIGYTAKPTLSNLTLTYLDIEHNTPQNTIPENGLRGQRWNSTLNTWTDYDPASSINTTTNQVTIASVNPANFFSWWILTYIADRHWVAATNSNWNNTANWSTRPGGVGGATVPSSFDEVFFDDVRDANSTLDVPATINALTLGTGYSGTVIQGSNALIVNQSATLSAGTFQGGTALMRVGGEFVLSGTAFTSPADTLDLKNNFTLTSGSFVHNNGTVKFSGTGALPQDITTANILNFNHIRATNTSANPGLRIQSSENLEGVLSLGRNAIVDADGSANTSLFTMISTADSPVKDAAIGILSGTSAVTGNIKVQRFMSREGGNNRRIYRYIASPLQNASVADIQNEILITGSFTGYSVCNTCLTNQSMFAYNEAITTDINGSGTADIEDGYIDFPDLSNTETLQPGRGYALFVRANLIPSALWDVTGIINAGNIAPIAMPVSFTSSGNILNDGWNLVGNPYPSSIDWNAVTGWTKTNIDASIYIRDNGAVPNRYATWNGVTGTNGGSRYIAMGQGFWVKASAGGPILRANENVKAPGQETTFFREHSIMDLLRITLSQGAAQDEAVIHFREDATRGFDENADAWKLKNETFNLSTLADHGEMLAINSRSVLLCDDSIKLSINDVVAGQYNLQFTNVNSFSSEATIFLIDKLLNKTTQLHDEEIYPLEISTNPATFGSERFLLVVKKSSDIQIHENAGILTVPFENNIQWYFNNVPIEGATSNTFVPQSSGSYSVAIKQGDCILTGAIEFVVTGVESLFPSGIQIHPNPTTGEFFITTSQIQIDDITVVNALGNKIGSIVISQDKESGKGSFNLEPYPAGLYLLQIKSGTERYTLKIIRN
jgi:hypothetical protein